MDLADDKILKHDNILADDKVFLIIDHRTWKDWLKMTDLTGITCYHIKNDWFFIYYVTNITALADTWGSIFCIKPVFTIKKKVDRVNGRQNQQADDSWSLVIAIKKSL